MQRGQPLILLLDLMILAVCFELAYYLRIEQWHGAIIELRGFWLMLITWVLGLYVSGSYDYRKIDLKNYFLRVFSSSIAT